MVTLIYIQANYIETLDIWAAVLHEFLVWITEYIHWLLRLFSIPSIPQLDN